MSRFLRIFCLLMAVVFQPVLLSAHDQVPVKRLGHPETLSYPPLFFSPPEPVRHVMANGLQLFILEDRELPLVNVQIMVRGGSFYDPEGKEGLAELTATVMRSGGAGAMRGMEVDRILENMACKIEASATQDAFVFSLSSLREKLNRSLEIMASILRQPRFDPGRLEVAREQMMEELRRLRDDAPRWAFHEFRRLIYSGDSRGRLPSLSSLKSISPADLAAVHRRFFYPENTMIAVSGDIDRREAREIMERLFGDWSLGGSALPPPPAPKPPRGGIHHMEKESPQSIVIAGRHAPGKNNPDFYPFTILDHIIGSGGFSARVTQRIRTDRGLAYSTGSRYQARSGFGVFYVYAVTSTERTEEVLKLIRSTLAEVTGKAISPREIASAQRSLVNAFLFGFQSSAQVVSQDMAREFYGLPADFLKNYCRRIEAVGVDDLSRVAHAFLIPDDMVILVMGSRQVQENLKRLYGHIREVSPPPLDKSPGLRIMERND